MPQADKESSSRRAPWASRNKALEGDVDVSIILGVKNEYPVILGTIHALAEELSANGWSHEIIIVDNGSTDYGPDILSDKFRRWVRHKYMTIIRYDEKPANVTIRNIGARAARGKYLIIGDGHLSIVHGTLDGMLRLIQENGDKGTCHTAANVWGDTNDIKCYGYRLSAPKWRVQELLGEPVTADKSEIDPVGTLKYKFWGDHCVGWPRNPDKSPGVPHGSSWWRVPMGKHSLLAVPRREYLDLSGYYEGFQCYGGGEPFLNLLWWTCGSSVYVYADGLHGHGFGHVPHTKEGVCCGCGKNCRRQWWCVRDRRLKKCGEKGEFLHYRRGYGWKNDWFEHNFILCAYLIGGYEWMDYVYRRYYHQRRRASQRYVDTLIGIRAKILRNAAEDRRRIQSQQKMSLTELTQDSPWDWA